MPNIRTTKKGCKQTDGRWQQKKEADSTCIISEFIIFCELLCIYFRAAAQNFRFKRRIIKSERRFKNWKQQTRSLHYEKNMSQRVRKTPAALPPSLLIGQHIPRLAVFGCGPDGDFFSQLMITAEEFHYMGRTFKWRSRFWGPKNQTEYDVVSRFLNQQLHQWFILWRPLLVWMKKCFGL